MSAAPSLFDGPTYEPDADFVRLNTQLGRVVRLMIDGKWRTLRQIVAHCGGMSEASASARLRDLRKPKFGAFNVERRPVVDGLFQYRVTAKDAHHA